MSLRVGWPPVAGRRKVALSSRTTVVELVPFETQDPLNRRERERAFAVHGRRCNNATSTCSVTRFGGTHCLGVTLAVTYEDKKERKNDNPSSPPSITH